MSCSFHPQARDEFLRAIDYYEDCAAGLGIDFATEVHDTIQRIVDFPDAWPELKEGIRRCMAGRFPFGVIYTAEDDDILVLAVMHLHKRPGYWAGRAGQRP